LVDRKVDPVAGLTIDTQRIAGAGDAVAEVAGSLTREISSMRELLDQIRAGWQSSDAAPRFVAAMEQHLADATRLKDALAGQGSALAAAAARFGEAEAALAQAIPAAI
jgi:WXG100 family type VII secretion target